MTTRPRTGAWNVAPRGASWFILSSCLAFVVRVRCDDDAGHAATQHAARSDHSGAISHPAGAGDSAWYFTLRRGSAISGSTASRHVA